MTNKSVPLEHQLAPTPITPAEAQDIEKAQAIYDAKAGQSMVLRTMTPKLFKKVYRLLKSGEDPVPVAVYFKLPFSEVAKIANRLLEDKGITQRIPEELNLYMRLAYTLAQQKANAAGEATPTPAQS
jgi:hypothetical protein